MNIFSKFAKDEGGAVTVDFVMLTSGTVVLGVAVLMVMAGGLHNGSNSIDSQIVNTVEEAAVVATNITASN